MQAGEYKLLIQLDMEELFSGKTVTTFGYIKPKGDILTQLKQQIDTDIETLQNSCPARKKAHNMYDYKSATRRESIWNSTTIKKTFERLTYNSEKYTKEWNPHTYLR